MIPLTKEREGAYLGLGLTQSRHDSAKTSAKQKEGSFEIGFFFGIVKRGVETFERAKALRCF